MQDIENLMLVEYASLSCKCGALLNPFATVDFRSKHWTCPFCNARNPFPKHYADHISEQTLPVELTPACSTMEYVLTQSQTLPSTFLYVIDTCIPEEDLQAIRDSI
jgi:protein transport protein SEC23